MKKSLIFIFLIALSVAIGLGWDWAYEQVELRRYPLEHTDLVDAYAEEYRVPREVVYAVIHTESSFRIEAQSHAGAIGLMQITPDTFDWLKLKMGERLDIGTLYDPNVNIKYGTYFLSMLYSEFNSWEVALAAYNAGLNRVKNDWILNEEYILDGKVIKLPYEETENYVRKVMKGIQIYKKLYGM